VYTVYTSGRLEELATRATAPVGADGACFDVLSIREARTALPQIVSSVASESRGSVAVGPHRNPAAAIVPYWVCDLLAPGQKKRKLAILIAEELLPRVPLHLKRPAVDELSLLPQRDLEVLWGIDSLPSSKGDISALQEKLSHPEILSRLIRRLQVAETLAAAREAGLYDAAEEATSDVMADLLRS
jgi:hypothetical protein